MSLAYAPEWALSDAERVRVAGWKVAGVLQSCATSGRPLTVRFANARRGEHMRSRFDCLRAALATVANCRYESLPDLGSPDDGPAAHRQALADLAAWAARRGQRLTLRDELPIDRPVWAGCVLPDGRDWQLSHAVVMVGADVAFDPAVGFPLPEGHQLNRVGLADVRAAYTLDPEESR